MTCLRRVLPLALTLLTACGPTFAVQQSSLTTLPTAPPPAAVSGRAALELGTAVAADATSSPRSGAESGMSIPRVQPEGAVTVRLADPIALRAWGAVALPQGSTQVTGTIDAPRHAAWMGAIGPVFRLRGAEGLFALELGTAFGFAVVPSHLRITPTSCEDGSDGCPGVPFERDVLEVMPIFAVRADVGMTPTEWFRFRIGGTVRNQPINNAAFDAAVSPDSSVSAGPIGIVIHAGLDVDFIDEIGMRAEVQWPAIWLGLAYGPTFTLSVQGRIGGDLDSPLGLEI